eukprot:scaffold133819_cov20-Tisochrysis_lutea.AAC.3
MSARQRIKRCGCQDNVHPSSAKIKEKVCISDDTHVCKAAHQGVGAGVHLGLRIEAAHQGVAVETRDVKAGAGLQ